MAKKEQEEELPKPKSRNQMRPKSQFEENEPREEASEKKQRNKSPESPADSGYSPNAIKNFIVRLRTMIDCIAFWVHSYCSLLLRTC